jgi:hypothetical protein
MTNFFHFQTPTRQNAVGGAALLALVNNSGLFGRRLKGPLFWVQHSAEVKRHPLTFSLFNEDQARRTCLFVMAMADIVGAERILVTSPYQQQVI